MRSVGRRRDRERRFWLGIGDHEVGVISRVVEVGARGPRDFTHPNLRALALIAVVQGVHVGVLGDRLTRGAAPRIFGGGSATAAVNGRAARQHCQCKQVSLGAPAPEALKLEHSDLYESSTARAV